MISSGWEYFLEVWNTFDRVEIHLYRVGILNTGLECFIQDWNALYSVEVLYTGLECFPDGFNDF
jgi:hypothetical protein